jgi:hypothetical protein
MGAVTPAADTNELVPCWTEADAQSNASPGQRQCWTTRLCLRARVQAGDGGPAPGRGSRQRPHAHDAGLQRRRDRQHHQENPLSVVKHIPSSGTRSRARRSGPWRALCCPVRWTPVNGQVSVSPKAPSSKGRYVEPVARSAASRATRPAGHWRAINPGERRATTVTRGHPYGQLRAADCGDTADSQADSAGSIPVTRSSVKPQVSGHSGHGSLACRRLVDLHGPLAASLPD